MKKTKQYLIIPTIVSCGLFSYSGVEASTIASFDFTGGSTASDPTTFATALTQGSGITGASTSNDILQVDGSQTLTNNTNLTSLNQALTNAINFNSFVTFTVTIGATESINLTSIDFDYTTIDPFDSALGVFSSVTGFTAGDQLAGNFGNGFTDPDFSGPVDLSGNTAFQDLTDTSVEFRFYLADNSTSNTRIHQLDNILLEGDITAVPEPSSTALLGLGGLALLARRRR